MRIPGLKLLASTILGGERSIVESIRSILTPGASIRSSGRRNRVTFALICAGVFVLALGVRLLHRQDSYTQIITRNTILEALGGFYRHQAEEVNRGYVLFPKGTVDPGDARMIIHPPGYSLFMAATDRVFGGESALRNILIVSSSLSCILILLIAAELLPLGVAIIAGLLAALSPHHAYYSLFNSPDSICVLPLLISVYLIIKARSRPRLIMILAAGVLVGFSCWLRANALLLAPFLALVIAASFNRGKRLRYSLAFLTAAVLVIAPVTIRNWVVYGHFIPLSIGAGITMIEGIADYDHENRFGFPLFDTEVAAKDAEWFGRPDYARNPWKPDGVERDQRRLARGLSVIKANPGWFMKVMLKRASSMLRYNDFAPTNRPTNTSIAPTISLTPGFEHALEITDGAQPVWSLGLSELSETIRLSQSARKSVDGSGLHVTNDGGSSRSLFVIPQISIEKNTDYLLIVKSLAPTGNASIKIGPIDPRIVLATAEIEPPDNKPVHAAGIPLDEGSSSFETKMPFASGDVAEVTLSFASSDATQPAVRISGIELFSFGATPNLWTRYVRAPLGAIQRNVFKTKHLLPLNVIGILLLIVMKRWVTLVMLLAIPVYYLVFQSVFHTEYRYILAIHYFLFVMSATTLFLTGKLAIQAGRRMKRRRLAGSEDAPVAD